VKIKKELIEMLKKHEGFKGKPYFCSAGKKTIGYGRNIDDVGFSTEEIHFLKLDNSRDFDIEPLSVTEAEFLLYNDIVAAINECKKLDIDFEKLDSVRQDVITDMMFNLGYHRLTKFKKTLRYVKGRLFHYAAVEMLDSKWARQVKSRAVELSNMMKIGAYL